MKLVGTGFLSIEGLAEAVRIESEISPSLLFVRQAIGVCHSGLEEIDLRSQESHEAKQKVIACVVLARMLEISEALVLLAKGGFSVDVTATFRNFLDAYFIFCNVCKDPAFVAQYFRSDLETRQKLLNAASKHRSELFELVNNYATQDLKDALKEQIFAQGAVKFDSYAHAHNVGCDDIYDSMYRVSSAATHSTPRALESYVREDPDGNVCELYRSPRAGDIVERLLDLGGFLLNTRRAFDELFGLSATAQIDCLNSRLEELSMTPNR